ncbi:hypothetical protein [Kitasatospora viridis]|uniref:Uncharacterized protein n=1 Tax=Kitasatospora viridis TaxID=281105 RepID=A0A561SAB0_9ACTN|nr:hypothetical protein [Kitasatospora viridis]TWF71744.1 hypothetical protein FHX73_18115 [Kitasatospora viridis]
MTSIDDTPSTFGYGTFELPPLPAKADAVRKLAQRLQSTLQLDEDTSTALAQASTDPAAVRVQLTQPLAGLSTIQGKSLLILTTRMWAPWLCPPADEIQRHITKKLTRSSSGGTVPPLPSRSTVEETSGGATIAWPNLADRNWHLADNARIYEQQEDPDSDLWIMADEGGIHTPLVVIPQTLTFKDGSPADHRLRIADGMRRYYATRTTLQRPEMLQRLNIDPADMDAAWNLDRPALLRVVTTLRTACEAKDEILRETARHLASVIALPVHVVVGQVSRNGTQTLLGQAANRYGDTVNLLHSSIRHWHTGDDSKRPRVQQIGTSLINGLPIPQAEIDSELLRTLPARLKARLSRSPQAPTRALSYGLDRTSRPAVRLVWWCRAVAALGGKPATALAGFAQHHTGTLAEALTGDLLRCTTYLMEEDPGAAWPPGDYRDPNSHPDSLALLVHDAENIDAVAQITSDGTGGWLTHPRERNAQHIALAELALRGLLPTAHPSDQYQVPDRLLAHRHLLSRAARTPDNEPITLVDHSGRTVTGTDSHPVTLESGWLDRNDFKGQKEPKNARYQMLLPTAPALPYPGVSHIFQLRHGVTLTVPSTPLSALEEQDDPDADLAQILRRWFPDATDLVMTDWEDLFTVGVMVGSVFVRIHDRSMEREAARREQRWYPEGRPPGTKDTLPLDAPDSGFPDGTLLGVGAHLVTGYDGPDGASDAAVFEALMEETSEEIIQEADDATRRHEAASGRTYHMPVVPLPAAGSAK